MTLVGMDGNAFFLMGLFSKNARRQGWPPHEIDAVLTEARAKDYDHLVATLMDYIEEPYAVVCGSGDDSR
jgi:hypothetical protein